MNAGEIMVLRSRSNGRMKEKKQRRPSKVGNHKNQKAGHSSSEIEAILQVLPDIFFVIDLDGSIVRWNRAGELITDSRRRKFWKNLPWIFSRGASIIEFLRQFKRRWCKERTGLKRRCCTGTGVC